MWAGLNWQIHAQLLAIVLAYFMFSENTFTLIDFACGSEKTELFHCLTA